MSSSSPRLNRLVVAGFALVGFASCVTTYSYLMPSEIEGGPAAVVSAEDTAFNVLDLISVDAKIKHRLMRECETGRVSGIETVLTDRVFYLCYPSIICFPSGSQYMVALPLFRYYKVRATGLCSVKHKPTPSREESPSEWE